MWVDTTMNVADASATTACVRRPAGRPWMSRSYPITPPNAVPTTMRSTSSRSMPNAIVEYGLPCRDVKHASRATQDQPEENDPAEQQQDRVVVRELILRRHACTREQRACHRQARDRMTRASG